MIMSSRYLLQMSPSATSSALAFRSTTRRHFSATFQRRSTDHQQQDYRDAPLKKPTSPHSQLYSNILPAMVPIFLLGSTIFLVRTILFVPFIQFVCSIFVSIISYAISVDLPFYSLFLFLSAPTKPCSLQRDAFRASNEKKK